MSEIQDLLNASTQDMVDDYLIIDDNSREIYVPLGELLFGVTNDEKTERKYFQCPRIVGDNVDLTQYQLYINYQNANGEKDKYIVTDVKVVDDNIPFLNYTLQNPLYKIGDVYDYIDFNRGKIIRNVGVVTFDGSDDELWNKYSNNVSMDGYSVNVSNAIDTISTTLEEAIKVLDNAMYVILNKIRGLNTTELFKSWLQSNPITVYYQLSTPTEEDIPTELLTQLKQLQTYSGETNISFEASDVYPTIDLEYIKDTKKYIESKEELDNQSIIDIDYRVTCLELDMEEQ